MFCVNATATVEIYTSGTTLSRHDALPICVPTQTGGLIGCMVNTPRVSVATITGAHLLDNLSYAANKSRRDRFNTVIPRFRDEDSDWQIVSGAPISVPDYVTADGGRRTKEI